jgi:hypothetical protein
MKSISKLPSRYRIDNRLGEGGFGEVFKAYDSHLKRTLAIKILTDKSTSKQETLTREFKTLSQLQHPNLVRVFDYGTLPPHTPYFTMELVDGQNLREYLQNKTNIFSIPLIIRQVLKALSYLHKNRILHGDIKPENIVITVDNNLDIETKLLDFGLAMSLGDERKLMSGTLRYLAPEILLHGSPNSPATDLYALGVSLVESILSMEVPGSNEMNETFFEKAYVELNGTLASAGMRNPSALSAFILDLCRVDPSDRMQDAKEAIRSFEMIADKLTPGQQIQISNIFVGRAGELGEIERRLAEPAAVRGVIILSGPRGIGKKSIVRKAVQIAQLKGFLPIDLTQTSSYFALDRLIEALGSNLGAKERRRFLSGLPAREEFGKDRVNTDLEPNRASAIYAHIIEFLAEISASQRVLIIVSDIDRSSKDLLIFIVQLIKRMELSELSIGLLITANADFANQIGLSEELSRIARSPLGTIIEVRPFDDKLLKQYLMKCFGGLLLPERERLDILSKTQGLPLLIAAFLKILLATDVIQNQEGHWLLDRRLYRQKQIPTGIDDSLSLSMRDLREDQVALLRVLALYGQPLKPDELHSLAQDIIGNPSQALTELLARTILAYHGDGTVSFAYPLYSQFIIEKAPFDIIKNYSVLLAERLVSKESNDSLRIAQLYISAEKVEEALEYGFHAIYSMYSSYMLYDCLKLLLDLKNLTTKKGNRSQLLDVLGKLAPIEHKTGLSQKAIEDYRTLVNSSRNNAQRAGYYIQLADIQYGLLGNVRDSRILLQKALRLATRASDTHLIAIVYHGLAALNPEKNIFLYEKAAALSREIDINLYLKSLAYLAYNYRRAGRAEKAIAIQETILKEIKKAELAAQKEIYSLLYSTSFYTADYKTARSYIMKKIQIEKKTEDSQELIGSISSLGGCFYTEGSFYRMIDALKEACQAAQKYGNYLSAITILSNLSLGYRSVADYGLSKKMLMQAEEIIKGENIQALNSAFLLKPAMLYLMLGQAKEAEFKIWVNRAYEMAQKVCNKIGSGHHSMAFAIYYMNKLQPDDALAHARKALSFFKKAADRDDVVSALVHIAIIQLSLGKPKLARTSLEQAEEIYEAIHCEYLKPLLMLGRSMLARQEHSSDAKKILADALRTSKKMGTRETTWQIQREFALYHKDQGEPHKALAFYKDAIETIKQITETLDEEELRLSYLEVPFRRRVFDEIKQLKREMPKA